MDEDKLGALAKLAVEYYGRQCFCKDEEELTQSIKMLFVVTMDALASATNWETTAEMLEALRIEILKDINRPTDAQVVRSVIEEKMH